MKPLLLLLLALLVGCATDRETAMQNKVDAALRQKVEESAREGGPRDLQVVGKCAGQVTDPMKAALAGAGARIQTVAGETFTAVIPAEAVPGVASLDFVTSLELAKQLKPL